MATYFNPQVMDPNYYSFHQPAPAMDPNHSSFYQPPPVMDPNYYTYYQPYPVQYSYNQQFFQPYQPQAQQQSTPEMLKQQELQQELLQQLQTRRNHKYSPQPRRERSQSPQSRQSRIPVSDNNVAIGSIVFLPARKSGSINTIQPGFNHKLSDGGYSHPAIITHIWDERQNGGELMTLCCMVSLNLHEKGALNRVTNIFHRSQPTPDQIQWRSFRGFQFRDYQKGKHQPQAPHSNLRTSCTNNRTSSPITSTELHLLSLSCSIIHPGSIDFPEKATRL
jgi:hypothetical protein